MMNKKIYDFLNRIKERVFKVRKVVLLVVILLLVDIILGLISRYLVAALPEQNEAYRWSDDTRMAQVSVFFTENQKIDENFIKKIEYSFENALVESGAVSTVENDSNKKGAGPVIIDTVDVSGQSSGNQKQERHFFDSCYSAQGITSMQVGNKSSDNITTIGVGGDFFTFHPLELVDGQFFRGDDLMKDGIVIDEDLAWQLFGSNDVVGQAVKIKGVPHYVTGVVKRQEGKIREASGLRDTIAYVSYDSLCKYGTILSGVTENVQISEDGKNAAKGGINCYEIVAPNPIDGLVKKLVTESLGIDEKYVSIIDNTDRFKFFSLFEVMSSFGTRSMWGKAIFYPYWENTARGYEDILAFIFMIRVICKAAIVFILVICIINSYRNKTWTVAEVTRKLMDKKYDLEVKLNARKEKKREESEKITKEQNHDQ